MTQHLHHAIHRAFSVMFLTIWNGLPLELHLYCIVFIHFYSAYHSLSLSEMLPTTAIDTVSEFTCRSTTFATSSDFLAFYSHLKTVVHLCPDIWNWHYIKFTLFD